MLTMPSLFRLQLSFANTASYLGKAYQPAMPKSEIISVSFVQTIVARAM